MNLHFHTLHEEIDRLVSLITDVWGFTVDNKIKQQMHEVTIMGGRYIKNNNKDAQCISIGYWAYYIRDVPKKKKKFMWVWNDRIFIFFHELFPML